MTAVALFPCGYGAVGAAVTGALQSISEGAVGPQRLPTDPLFYAALTLRNVVGGSRYRITRADTGAEMAAGTVAGSGLVDATVSALACYANPQPVIVTVRQGTTAPKYLPGVWQTEISKLGGAAYIAQIADPVA